MKQLYSPWREEYTRDVAHTKDANATEDQCVFCNHFKQDTDEQNFILRRFDNFIVMLNRYPYNAGHLLILPIKHLAHLSDLNKQTRAELMELTHYTTEIAKETFKCDGVNVGLNLGKAAGAGIPSHLHMHVLPRFFGDTNFLPALADTKAISFDLKKMYATLKPKFQDISL
jgi:ATP adenylyltransferase